MNGCEAGIYDSLRLVLSPWLQIERFFFELNSLGCCGAVCSYDSSVFVLLLVGYGSGSGFVVVALARRFSFSSFDGRVSRYVLASPLGVFEGLCRIVIIVVEVEV